MEDQVIDEARERTIRVTFEIGLYGKQRDAEALVGIAERELRLRIGPRVALKKVKHVG